MTTPTTDQMRAVDLAKLQCRARWSRRYPAGRVCAHGGCDTPLSIYNSEAYCYPHRPEPDPLRFHGMSFVLCEGCGAVLGHGGRIKTADRVCRACRKECAP